MLLLCSFQGVTSGFSTTSFSFVPFSDGKATSCDVVMDARKSRGNKQSEVIINIAFVLSCLLSLECTLWEGFFWRMPKQAYTVPCRASPPRGQGAQVLCT